MVSSSKDVAVIAGILGIAYIAYRGIGGFLNNFKAPELPSINISNPFNLSQSSPVETTYPNATQQTQDYLESIQGGFTSLDTTLDNYLKSLNQNLPPLGSNENPANSPVAPTPIDVILNDPTLTQQQKDEALAILNPPPIGDQSGDETKFMPKEGQPPYDPYNPYGIEIEGEIYKTAGQPKTALEEVIPKSQTDEVQQTFKQQDEITKVMDSQIKDESVNITGVFGTSAVGEQSFIINENPIDTFSEVLKYFPELTASQARDFLDETGGKILPSQVDLVDPDIKNIVAGFYGGGQNQSFEVDTFTTQQERDMQELISAQFTCKEYGLNCDIAEQMA